MQAVTPDSTGAISTALLLLIGNLIGPGPGLVATGGPGNAKRVRRVQAMDGLQQLNHRHADF